MLNSWNVLYIYTCDSPNLKTKALGITVQPDKAGKNSSGMRNNVRTTNESNAHCAPTPRYRQKKNKDNKAVRR